MISEIRKNILKVLWDLTGLYTELIHNHSYCSKSCTKFPKQMRISRIYFYTGPSNMSNIGGSRGVNMVL